MYCSHCFPGSNKAIKTIRKHLLDDQAHLIKGPAGQNPELSAHIAQCVQKNIRALKENGTLPCFASNKTSNYLSFLN
jgi:hypothetical protein